MRKPEMCRAGPDLGGPARLEAIWLGPRSIEPETLVSIYLELLYLRSWSISGLFDLELDWSRAYRCSDSGLARSGSNLARKICKNINCNYKRMNLLNANNIAFPIPESYCGVKPLTPKLTLKIIWIHNPIFNSLLIIISDILKIESIASAK